MKCHWTGGQQVVIVPKAANRSQNTERWGVIFTKRLAGEGTEKIGGVFAQRAHSASYYGVYPGNSPENLPPLEACMSNSKVRNSNVSCSENYPMSKTMQCRQ